MPAIVEGFAHVSGVGAPDATSATRGLAAATGLVGAATGALLLAGFLTPIAGVVVGLWCACHALAWIPLSVPHVIGDGLATLLLIVVAVAVVLLGPGAWSLDAHLFGRRRIVIS